MLYTVIIPVTIRGDAVYSHQCHYNPSFIANRNSLSERLNGLVGRWGISAFQPMDVPPFPTDPLKKYGERSGECCSLFDSGYDPEKL